MASQSYSRRNFLSVPPVLLIGITSNVAPVGGNPVPASEENLIAGAKLYRQMCSHCHGVSKESENSYGQSFYPPAPNLPLRRATYTDSEMFWIVKHGIRNTAMPAWGNFLSNDEIWQVVTLVRKFDSLPDSVTVELLAIIVN